ncbi:alpha/beta hydrolase [Cohnella mopanensis]|uniref:alpha/beta hydrolase n=1 Tax=Cohnella mopanensis TaxID=2911966 RepID=UPI001EF9388B|nr:alpha/beta hydrolase [Cohnella mopanensis]
MRTTLTYKQVKDCTLSADVIIHERKSPVLIYLHSGGLIFGTRKWLSEDQIDFYANAGYNLVAIDYRLAPETKLTEIIEDIRDAINWVRTSICPSYGINSDRIALLGCSAGAYLSLLIGTMDIRPQAIVSFYGYGDILGDWIAKPSPYYCQRPKVNPTLVRELVGKSELTEGDWSRFEYYLYCRQNGIWLEEVTGLDRDRDEWLLNSLNPIHLLTNQFPPTLFLHGDQDTDVPYEQSVAMNQALQKLGVDSELITIEGADHVFDQHFNDPAVREAFEQIRLFLDRVFNKVGT